MRDSHGPVPEASTALSLLRMDMRQLLLFSPPGMQGGAKILGHFCEGVLKGDRVSITDLLRPSHFA